MEVSKGRQQKNCPNCMGIQRRLLRDAGPLSVEQRRVYSIYYYGTLTLPYEGRGERAVEAVAVRVDSGREQETLLFYTRYRLLYILSYKRDGHGCIA